MKTSPNVSRISCLCLALALLAFPVGCGSSDAGDGGPGGSAGEGGSGGSAGEGGTAGSAGEGGTAGSAGEGGTGGSAGEGGIGGSAGTLGTPEGYNKTWSGVVSNDWFEPLNWEPEGIPVSTDNVYISPDAAGQPDRTRDAISVNDLLIPEGASFTNSSSLVRVRVFGDLDATGGIDGSGPIVLLGGTIKGTVHRVEVWEPSSLSGDTTITDRIGIFEVVDPDGDASLTLSGHTLATQNFSCCSNGAVGLIMDDPADRLIVEGESRFVGSTGSTLSAGEIELRGDVLFCEGGLETPFRSTGTKVLVSGQGPQTFSSIFGCATGAVVLSELELVAPADLANRMALQISGDLLVAEGASIAYGGNVSIFSNVGGDIDLSGSMVVDFINTAKLQVLGTLKLNATGVLDDAGDIINLSACDPKDGTIVNVDPCP
ncbi:MAG: hypothetical protein KJO44_02150 [Gemmatimonadetes bacterium]|nr:hypothetical protein [Gemmatimonadota bacterium]